MGILSNQNHSGKLDHRCHYIEVDCLIQYKDNFLGFHPAVEDLDHQFSE